jgi:hypothetical protein
MKMPKERKLAVLVRALEIYRDLFAIVPVGEHASAVERVEGARRIVPQFGT